ncbi:MAG TPA: recombinase family protein [Rhizomicrobium sp.]
MSTKRQIRCAIYTRKSSEEGLEQDFNSLDAQREACEAYVASQKAEGWICLRDHFDDGGFSGGTLERPALQRLMKEIEDGKVDVIVVYKIDRLSRSLMDFAKLVEAFDRKSVTFVSVTQSFNTTNSMGRLTLNVLLSFAQFEREVTGERIRDKFAASKKKGIWMGGNPPLGYDVLNRKLVVNPAEAKTVRLIFQHYLDLGCVRLLRADLAARNVVSKRRIFESGQNRGGKSMGRSALYCILNNRAYIGETTHKGASYPGEHEAIVPRKLFDAVQQQLAELRPPASSKSREAQDALYAGLLFDETGTPMLPTYTVKRGGLRYRYYASRPTLKGERSEAAIWRIPAPPFEALVSAVMERLGLDARAAIGRIDVLADRVVVRLKRDADKEFMASCRPLLADGQTIEEDGQTIALTLPVRAKFRGGRAVVREPLGSTLTASRPDTTLIKAIARAHHWRRLLEDGEVASIGELARRLKQDRGHVGLTLNLAFLSPALTRAILGGEQPPDLRLGHLLNADIPLSWREQDAVIRAAPAQR